MKSFSDVQIFGGGKTPAGIIKLFTFDFHLSAFLKKENSPCFVIMYYYLQLSIPSFQEHVGEPFCNKVPANCHNYSVHCGSCHTWTSNRSNKSLRLPLEITGDR